MVKTKESISNIRLINPETKESITVCPELGGSVTSLILGKNLIQILDSDSDGELLNNPLFRGRILFPFNDRIPEGAYSFKGRKYQLAINSEEDNSAIHGFIYNKQVTILEQKKVFLSFIWRTGKNIIKGYPFDISLKTDIKLHNGGVSLYFTVLNHGNTPAPFALGWHSYYNTDPESRLQAEYPYYFEIDSQFLPVGEEIPTDTTKFDFSNGAFFLEKQLDHTLCTGKEGISFINNKNYTVKIQQKNFPYTQLFVPPDRKSLALEPISSKPNSFNTEEVLVLEPGGNYIANLSIDISEQSDLNVPGRETK